MREKVRCEMEWTLQTLVGSTIEKWVPQKRHPL